LALGVSGQTWPMKTRNLGLRPDLVRMAVCFIYSIYNCPTFTRRLLAYFYSHFTLKKKSWGLKKLSSLPKFAWNLNEMFQVQKPFLNMISWNFSY
jgi:Sec-independent protein secretion pathway component TatC